MKYLKLLRWFLYDLPQARSQGVQTGAIAHPPPPPPPPPPPLDARSAWQAMNIIHFIVQSTHILIRTAMCTSACKSTGTGSSQGCIAAGQAFGLWLDPFCPRSMHLEKGYTDKIVCIYPVWIIIYHIEVSSQVPSPNHMTTMFGAKEITHWPQWFQKRS